MRTAIDRFDEKVIKDKESECWNWIGSKYKKGYGYFYYNRKTGISHRWSYEYHIGAIPDGLTIDHLCRNTSCVNPKHLEPVTNRENILRGEGVTAKNAVKTHCKHGHEFTPENTRLCKLGRDCYECIKIRCRKYRQRLKIRASND